MSSLLGPYYWRYSERFVQANRDRESSSSHFSRRIYKYINIDWWIALKRLSLKCYGAFFNVILSSYRTNVIKYSRRIAGWIRYWSSVKCTLSTDWWLISLVGSRCGRITVSCGTLATLAAFEWCAFRPTRSGSRISFFTTSISFVYSLIWLAIHVILFGTVPIQSTIQPYCLRMSSWLTTEMLRGYLPPFLNHRVVILVDSLFNKLLDEHGNLQVLTLNISRSTSKSVQWSSPVGPTTVYRLLFIYFLKEW